MHILQQHFYVKRKMMLTKPMHSLPLSQVTLWYKLSIKNLHNTEEESYGNWLHRWTFSNYNEREQCDFFILISLLPFERLCFSSLLCCCLQE